jgi:hypothetical protein
MGTCGIFMCTGPLSGKRYVSASEQRMKKDWAREIQRLLAARYPEAEQAVLVMDNLNTHVLSSLYEAFPAEEAFSLARRLEIHYTPKHGSWLNITEIALSALSLQCLARRIDTLEKLREGLSYWQEERNGKSNRVRWQFTTADARIKLRALYPVV